MLQSKQQHQRVTARCSEHQENSGAGQQHSTKQWFWKPTVFSSQADHFSAPCTCIGSRIFDVTLFPDSVSS